ncbi:U6 snRNA-associated Sm-like protein LSm1 isoform X1 [Procambarus clarkii]|uniref:U6 snRNA-associated Sm-like protein LSm1 isoform X1 n=2 Tax=Procambarus clarkii TaxID=6728 RepID=UPI001E67578C|nr:U6 snRNA-associated Sm-like protein LSm1 isoform X1 [Procambarus clarkii]
MTSVPGAAQLFDELDKKLMVYLRDGRTLIGYLRSVDQFANLVLHRTIERIHVGTRYGDIDRGVFVIRGENVVLLGEIDDTKEEAATLEKVSIEEILEAQRVEQERRQEQEQLRARFMKERGLQYTAEIGPDDMY